jgi:DNA-binding response OmpR family regulator
MDVVQLRIGIANYSYVYPSLYISEECATKCPWFSSRNWIHAMYTILVADDDETMRDLLRLALGFEDDWDVTVMSGAMELLETASTVIPDLVILDVAMPSLNGLDAFALLRTVHSTQCVPVLFLTADRDRVAKTMLNTRCAVLAKPFALDDLFSLIRRLLSVNEASPTKEVSA